MIRLILKSLLLIFVLVVLFLPPNVFKKEKPRNINDVPGAVKMITTLKTDSGKEIQVEYVKEKGKWVPKKAHLVKAGEDLSSEEQ